MVDRESSIFEQTSFRLLFILSAILNSKVWFLKAEKPLFNLRRFLASMLAMIFFIAVSSFTKTNWYLVIMFKVSTCRSYYLNLYLRIKEKADVLMLFLNLFVSLNLWCDFTLKLFVFLKVIIKLYAWSIPYWFTPWPFSFFRVPPCTFIALGHFHSWLG